MFNSKFDDIIEKIEGQGYVIIHQGQNKVLELSTQCEGDNRMLFRTNHFLTAQKQLPSSKNLIFFLYM